jgi:hypothetical protein
MFDFERVKVKAFLDKEHEITFKEIDFGIPEKIRYQADSLFDRQCCDFCNIPASFMIQDMDSILHALSRLDVGIKVVNYKGEIAKDLTSNSQRVII